MLNLDLLLTQQGAHNEIHKKTKSSTQTKPGKRDQL
jgi:hypothetical protein